MSLKPTVTLTQEQIDIYRENGFLLVKGLLTREEYQQFRAAEDGAPRAALNAAKRLA